MSGLEEIKARAAEPAAIRHRPHYQYVTALEASQADVMKLVALVEKIQADNRERAEQFRNTANRMWELIRLRDPERSLQDAERYEAYAMAHSAEAIFIEKAIKEALQ